MAILVKAFEQLPGNFCQFFSGYREILPNNICMPNFRSIGPSKQKLQNLPSPSHANLQKARPV